MYHNTMKVFHMCFSLAHVNPTSEPLLNLGGQQWIRFLHRQKPADLETENRCGVESGNKLKAASTVVPMVEMRHLRVIY
jgi:hypothetical protein